MKGKELFERMQDIQDDILEEAACDLGARQSVQSKKRIIVLLVAAMVLLLTACVATYVMWDSIFYERFHPSEAIVRQTKGGVQAVSATSECDGYLFSIRQTLGDNQTMYIALDITFPATIPLSTLLTRDERGEYNMNIQPTDLHFYRGKTEYAEVKGMDFHDLEVFYEGRKFGGGGSSSVEGQGVDLETNTMSYLISFARHGGMIADGEEDMITMLIGGMEQTDAHTCETIARGPFVISWSPQNSGTIYEFEVKEGASSGGKATLSAFALNVKLYASAYGTWEDFRKTVSITLKDGTMFHTYGFSGGSFSAPSGALEYGVRFKELLMLDEVESIQFGTYDIKLQEASQ